ncbi:MAG: DUF2268 domain-containing putative Zn-dependent protease [candidate division Zixibacteria bacterium]
MRIIDLTEKYLSKFINEGDRDGYERSCPDLFYNYYRFWAKRELNITIVDYEEIQKRKKWVTRLIEKLKIILNENNIDDSAIDFIYFIGAGTTNGHAFRSKDKWLVWLPLETYSSEKLVEVFVTHELIHALHYNNSPSFYFNSKNEMLQISRQLITEGLATYLTREFLGISNLEALWADYLSDDDALRWWEKCIAEERNLYRLISQYYYKSDHKLEIFYASNPDNIYQFRSGYFAGLRLVERYAMENGLSAEDILELIRARFEKDIANLLQPD